MFVKYYKMFIIQKFLIQYFDYLRWKTSLYNKYYKKDWTINYTALNKLTVNKINELYLIIQNEKTYL